MMHFDPISPQQFEHVATGGRFNSSVVIAPPIERIENAARKIGIACKVKVKPDGSLGFHAYDLAFDTVLETQHHGDLTVADALKLEELAGGGKLRCQAPFRASDSFAAFLALGSAGKPFIFDSGTDTKHWLKDADWNLLRGVHSSDGAEITPLFSIDAYRAGRFIGKEPPPRRWLFKNVLPFGKVGIIVAPGGTGKSQALMQIGVSAVTGSPLFGVWEVGETGSVLMLLAEDDEEEIHRRLNNVIGQLALSGDIAAIAALRKNLILKSMVGENNLMTETNQSREVQQTIYVDRLIATAAQIPDLKLIVIDPASRFRGGDENAAQDTTRFVEAIELLAQATGATILIAHHTNKGSMQATDASQNASRGSSALTDGVRWQMNLAGMSDKEAKAFGINPDERHYYLTATITKNNYAPPQQGLILKRGEGGYLHQIALTSQKTQQAHDVKAKIVQLVATAASAGQQYSKTAFAARFGGAGGALGIGDNGVRTLLDELLAAKALSTVKRKLVVPQRVKRTAVAGSKPDNPIS